ncbi:MAG: HAMP domain-containing histidine kinase [Cryobacterium sp.]|nr:HAMP domain-containing histidine kinase [Oligoflexia bacterium]
MDVKSVNAHDVEGVRIGKLHGADRADNTTYQLTELISEYHILREVIFQVLETDGQMSLLERDIILDSIEQAVNDAAVKFSEVHAEIQQKFIDTLTHDLKNPISAAKLNAQLIKKSDSIEKHATLSDRIVGSLNRLEAMIHDLLDAGRVRAGEPLTLLYSECDLDSVVRDVVLEMASIHGQRFIVNSPAAVWGTWGCDGVRRAIENLIGNAVKYGADGAPITVSVKKGDKAVSLSVHNEGVPIPENEVQILFKQHRRSKSAEASGTRGWGLGLTVVKGVVEAHRGEIHVESAKGRGTSFILDLPFSNDASAV